MSEKPKKILSFGLSYEDDQSYFGGKLIDSICCVVAAVSEFVQGGLSAPIGAWQCNFPPI